MALSSCDIKTVVQNQFSLWILPLFVVIQSSREETFPAICSSIHGEHEFNYKNGLNIDFLNHCILYVRYNSFIE